MQVRKQQLELDMEQQTGSKLGKEYIKAVYCQPAYLTYMQSLFYTPKALELYLSNGIYHFLHWSWNQTIGSATVYETCGAL